MADSKTEEIFKVLRQEIVTELARVTCEMKAVRDMGEEWYTHKLGKATLEMMLALIDTRDLAAFRKRYSEIEFGGKL